MTDTRIVGSFLGEDALAAVGATTTLSNLIIGFLLGLANGFAIITAQRFGAKDIRGVKKSFAASLVLGTVISVVLTVLGLVFLQPILRFLNVPEHLKKYKARISFDLTQEELDNQVLIVKKSGERVELSRLKFDRIPVTVEYDKMEAGQRYMVQQKQGSNRYFIIDRVPEEEG